MILEEQFPVPRNTSVSKIGNSVISLLWQLRCHCNPDHKRFSALSNTTALAIFPKPCLWRRSLCSNLGGVGLEKLYRATLMVVSRKVKGPDAHQNIEVFRNILKCFFLSLHISSGTWLSWLTYPYPCDVECWIPKIQYINLSSCR